MNPIRAFATIAVASCAGPALSQVCVPSGSTDQNTYFVAVDATDRVSYEIGLSSFTVYRSRNGAAEEAMTTPTIAEIDATNMPGTYALLVDEDTTIDAGDDWQAMAFRITHAGMAPITKEICLARPKATLGETLTVSSGTAASDPITGAIALTDFATAPGSAGGLLIAGSNAATTFASAAITGGFTIGDGLVITRSTSNQPGLSVTGNGTGAGAQFTSGSGATGNGINAVAASTNGSGIAGTATGSGVAISDPGGVTTLLSRLTATRAAYLDLLASLGYRTTITVTDQDTFVLAAGSADDNAYNGWGALLIDQSTPEQVSLRIVADNYDGDTLTANLTAAAGFTVATGDTVILLPAFLTSGVDVTTFDGVPAATALPLGGLVNCEVNTANFAGSTSTLACILTDTAGGAVTQANGDLEGRLLEITSGAQVRESRFINATTWDGANSELRLTLSRPLPGTLADGVTAIIR